MMIKSAVLSETRHDGQILPADTPLPARDLTAAEALQMLRHIFLHEPSCLTIKPTAFEFDEWTADSLRLWRYCADEKEMCNLYLLILADFGGVELGAFPDLDKLNRQTAPKIHAHGLFPADKFRNLKQAYLALLDAREPFLKANAVYLKLAAGHGRQPESLRPYQKQFFVELLNCYLGELKSAVVSLAKAHEEFSAACEALAVTAATQRPRNLGELNIASGSWLLDKVVQETRLLSGIDVSPARLMSRETAEVAEAAA